MSTARALGLMLLVIVIGGALVWGLVYWVATTYDRPLHFPESVTVPHRSCYADRCVQALPGGLIRVTDRAGTVIGVWWR